MNIKTQIVIVLVALLTGAKNAIGYANNGVVTSFGNTYYIPKTTLLFGAAFFLGFAIYFLVSIVKDLIKNIKTKK